MKVRQGSLIQDSNISVTETAIPKVFSMQEAFLRLTTQIYFKSLVLNGAYSSVDPSKLAYSWLVSMYLHLPLLLVLSTMPVLVW